MEIPRKGIREENDLIPPRKTDGRLKQDNRKFSWTILIPTQSAARATLRSLTIRRKTVQISASPRITTAKKTGVDFFIRN